ncbi:hypothetical protein [Streptomyces mirabilis]|uniref:hypothetical protein n=1 Tax=Streptomyces mirabilis TaxID=68239 RepID=UPI0036E9D89F
MHPSIHAGEFASALRRLRSRTPKDGEVTVGEDGVPRVTIVVPVQLPMPEPSLEGLAEYTELLAESWSAGNPFHPWATTDHHRFKAEYKDAHRPDPALTAPADLAARVIANIARWRANMESHQCRTGDRCRCPKSDSLRVIDAVLCTALIELASVGSIPWPVVTREALIAALVARNAAIEGDAEGVNAFSRTWLGLTRPERWREAVEMALLGDWVEQLGSGSTRDPSITSLLHRHRKAEHQRLQPLWERRVRGKRTALLSRPVGDSLTLADALPGARSPEALLNDTFIDDRISTVLSHLSAEETEIALSWARAEDSWAESADGVGQEAAYGERVRRKLKRLGSEYTPRQVERVVREGGA